MATEYIPVVSDDDVLEMSPGSLSVEIRHEQSESFTARLSRSQIEAVLADWFRRRCGIPPGRQVVVALRPNSGEGVVALLTAAFHVEEAVK